METTITESFPETLSDLLIPTDPALAREMATFHVNALLRCVLNALPESTVAATIDALAAHLAGIEALLAA